MRSVLTGPIRAALETAGADRVSNDLAGLLLHLTGVGVRGAV